MVVFKQNIEAIIPYGGHVFDKSKMRMFANENPLGVSSHVVSTLQKSMEEISLYPDGSCTQLKEKLAQKYNLEPDHFIIGNGSDELFILIADAVLDEKNQMITSTVTFSEYAFAATINKAENVFVPLREGKFDLIGILEKITSKTKMIAIANPNNPTGTYVTHSELISFLDKVPQHILVLIDEAYGEFASENDFPDGHSIIQTYSNCILTRTFSKAYGLAGLRIGYGMASARLIHSINKIRPPYNVNVFAQIAALAVLEDTQFLQKTIAVNEAGKEYLYAEFDKMELRYYLTAGNFIFVYLPIDGTIAFLELLKKNIVIRPMASFGILDAIRVTICTEKQNKAFISHLKELLVLQNDVNHFQFQPHS